MSNVKLKRNIEIYETYTSKDPSTKLSISRLAKKFDLTERRIRVILFNETKRRKEEAAHV